MSDTAQSSKPSAHPLTESHVGVNPSKIALLQALGIDLYTPTKSIETKTLKWLDDVCDLLNIKRHDCFFDSSTPSFDEIKKQLHLPALIYVDEISFKKTVWQNIRQYVD